MNQTHSDYKIIVVDHGSTDGTKEFITTYFKSVDIILTNSSKWWAGAVNIAIRKILKESKNYNDLIITLNNDLEVNKDYLEQLLKVYELTKPSLIGSITVNIENTNQVIYCGIKWNNIIAKYTNNYLNTEFNKISNSINFVGTDLLSGRGTLYPIELFRKYRLFDENNFPHYAADEDFSLMASRHGYDLVISTKAVIKSHYKESGLKKDRKTIINYFSSLKSPANLKRRLIWARKHSPVPYIYFMFDFIRIFISYFKLKLR